MDTEVLKRNINSIKDKIKVAAQKSGNDFDQIKLIAVTKSISPEIMEKVICEGIVDFAENKVQEFLKKYDIFSDRCKWHFIGRLQTNKVKYIIDKVTLIHSVDRVDLAKEISKRASQIQKCVGLLVQVNISGEVSKAGIEKDFLVSFLKTISILPNIRIIGLMTIVPHYEDAEKSRWIFKQLKQLTIDIKKENIHNVSMHVLSMGMSDDFEVAVEEGSNVVRVGSAIFT